MRTTSIARFLLLFLTVILVALLLGSCRSSRPAAVDIQPTVYAPRTSVQISAISVQKYGTTVPKTGQSVQEYFSYSTLDSLKAPRDSVRTVDFGYYKEEVVVEKRAKDPQAEKTCWPCVIVFVASAPLIFIL